MLYAWGSFMWCQSLRMGTDKGLLTENDTKWAQSEVDKISSLGIPVVLSVNSSQFTNYSSAFHPAQLKRTTSCN